jgi:hypothetical protein
VITFWYGTRRLYRFGDNFNVIGVRRVDGLRGEPKTEVIYGNRNFSFCIGNLRRHFIFGVDDVVFIQTKRAKEEIIILWFHENKGRIIRLCKHSEW